MKGTSPTLLSIPFSLHICQPWNMIIDYCIFASPYSPSASFFFSFFYFLCAFLLPASATVLSIGEVVVLCLSWQEVRTGQCVCRLIIDWRRLIRCYWSARAFELSTNTKYKKLGQRFRDLVILSEIPAWFSIMSGFSIGGKFS